SRLALLRGQPVRLAHPLAGGVHLAQPLARGGVEVRLAGVPRIQPALGFGQGRGVARQQCPHRLAETFVPPVAAVVLQPRDASVQAHLRNPRLRSSAASRRSRTTTSTTTATSPSPGVSGGVGGNRSASIRPITSTSATPVDLDPAGFSSLAILLTRFIV